MKKSLLLAFAALLFLGAKAETVTLALPSADDFAGWTVIDANGDGTPYLWAYGDEDAVYTQNKSAAANDWLISPAVTLKGGASYKVSSYLRNASSFNSDTQKITINAGSEPTPDALSTEIYKNESLSRGSYFNNYDGIFTPAADGEYYFAIHCYSSAYMGDLRFQKFVIEEQISHPGAVTDLAATPAPEGELKVTLSWTWPTKGDLGGDFAGTVSANIYRHTSSSFPSDLTTCLVGTVTDGEQGAPGEYVDATIPEAGKYYYRVVTFNADGTSTSAPANVSTTWVGMDSAVKPASNAVATVVDDHTVSLDFTPATEGNNGGYIDPAGVSYKITRTAGNDDAVVLEEAYTGELPYIDSDIQGLNSYTYAVYTIYNGTTSWNSTRSNAVVLGGAVTVPYSQDFSTSNHFFSFFCGEGTTRNWSVSSSRLQFWGSPANAYAVSPGIELSAGRAYELSFSTRISNSSTASYKDLTVLLGAEASAEGLDKELFTETIQSTFDATKTVKFSVAENGVYYLAFRCTNSSNSNDLYVDDLNIKEISVAPLAVSDLSATAAAEGEHSVTLSWTNPAEDNTGDVLTAISRIVIARNGAELATIEGATPGETATYTDDSIEDAGTYTYTVTAWLGDNASEAVDVTSDWVGLDTPLPVSAVTAAYDDATMTVTVSWEGVASEGVHGGYVDTADITYTVVRKPGDFEVVSGTDGLSLTDNIEGLELGRYCYEVSIDGYADVAPATSDYLTLGAAINLPYEPNFATAATFDLWTLDPGEGSSNWKHNSSTSTFEASFTSNKPWAFTPPFHTVEGLHRLVYRATCYSARYTEDIEVVLTKTPSATAEDMQVLDTRKIESVSWPSDIEVLFDVPEDGTYYIGYHVTTDDNWKLALHKSDIFLVKPTVGVDTVSGDGTLCYDAATATLAAAGDILVFSTDGVLVARGTDSLNISSLPAGIYIARAGAAVIKFVK
ncbi:MAG: choice-of-anchor J domain-containing protein [Muribaculaceae bacterium]|nr:choice-of-anchor J domain-containing protein [Muribaculaceae bacterium]